MMNHMMTVTASLSGSWQASDDQQRFARVRELSKLGCSPQPLLCSRLLNPLSAVLKSLHQNYLPQIEELVP